MDSEAATARRAGRAAEKTNEVPLIRCGVDRIRQVFLGEKWGKGLAWWSTTTLEPAQKPPAEQSPLAIEPMSMSTSVAYVIYA